MVYETTGLWSLERIKKKSPLYLEYGDSLDLMLCAYAKCVKQRREKSIYCSERCTRRNNTKRNQKLYKNVFNDTGGPGAMSGVSSIKQHEILGGASMSFGTLDDYSIDQDIFDIALQDHEYQKIARSDYEHRIVLDGFVEFNKSFTEKHGKSYSSWNYNKMKEDDPEKYKEFLERQKYYNRKHDDKRKNKINPETGKICSERS